MPLRKATEPTVITVQDDSDKQLAAQVDTYVDKAQAKDRRISRQGLYQAALNSPALMQYAPTLEDYLKLVRQVAEEGLRFVNE